MRFVKRNVEDNPCCKASDIAKTVDVSLKTAVCYLHKLGYYDRSARRKPLLHPTNINPGKIRLIKWLRGPWHFGLLLFSLMSHDFLYFQTVVE